MGSFKASVLILKTFIEFCQWLSGAIDDAQFHHELSQSKAWVKKATTGALPDRLEGGKDAENDFNSHAPKS